MKEHLILIRLMSACDMVVEAKAFPISGCPSLEYLVTF